MPNSRTLLHVATVLAGLTFGQSAAAESLDPVDLKRANATALAAYRRADVRRARSVLQRAARAAKRSGTRGLPLARTYANLGAVIAGGAHDHERAVRAFRRALREAPSVSVDPELESPEVRAAFRAAAAGTSTKLDGSDEEDTQDAEADASDPPGDDRADPHEPEALGAAAAPHVPSPSETAEHAWQHAEAQLSRGPVVGMHGTDHADVSPREHAHVSEAQHEHPRWFVEMGVGVGFSALRQGHAPDRLPESHVFDEVVASASDEETKSVNTEEVERQLHEEGWDCQARAADGTVHAEDCSVATKRGISVMEPIFDMAFGYHVLPRLSLALSALVQRNHGEGPMAGVVVGLRSEYLITVPAERGFQLGALAGVGVGTLQARGRGSHHAAPHATNAGPGGVGATIGLGAKAAYRTNQHLAFSVLPLFNLGLPYVLYDIGMTGGVEVAF